MTLRSLVGLLLGVALTACAPGSPDVGAPQGDGTAVATFDAHSDGAQPFSVEVVFPADEQGQPLPGPRLGAVLLADDGVDPSDYRGLAQALARQGVVVALPELNQGRAALDPNRANAARDLLRSTRGLLAVTAVRQVAALGQGGGAQVALGQTAGGPFDAVALLGTTPDAPGPGSTLTVPSLVLAAAGDCVVSEDALKEAWAERLPSPSVFVALDGVDGSQFTDTGASRCAPGLDREVAQARMASALSLFLQFALNQDPSALAALQAPTSGQTVVVR